MLHLTSQEQKTIIFISSLLILGIGIDFLRKQTSINLVNLNISEDQLFEKVDINKATLAELNTIPNVGDEMAKAIIEYRKSQGGFKNIEELKNVKGIKDKKFQQIKKYITIDNHAN